MKKDNLLEFASEFNRKFIDEKKFSLSDTGVNHRLITYWDEKGLLDKPNSESKWRKFDLEELVWIRLIAKLREFSIGVDLILSIKNELFRQTTLQHFIERPGMEKVYEDIMKSLENGGQYSFGNLSLTIDNLNSIELSGFRTLLQAIYVTKINYSLIVYLPNSTVQDSINPSRGVNVVLYSPDRHEEFKRNFDYKEVFGKSNLSISLTELVEDVIVNINPLKLPEELNYLSDEELLIFKTIRSGNFKSIKIRFDESAKVSYMEVAEVKKLKMESRIYEMVHKGAYQHIEIDSQDGKVVHCENKTIIKLKNRKNRKETPSKLIIPKII